MYIDLNGISTESYKVTYEHGLGEYVHILPYETIITSMTDIVHAAVFFATQYDGINETLQIDFNHPSLHFEYLSISPNVPRVLYISGIANADIYQSALQQVTYKNKKGSPTTGVRIIGIKLYNGVNGNNVLDTYVELDVKIINNPPMVMVNGDMESYQTRFYPRNSPVYAINPFDSLFIDEDSLTINKATVTIRNALDSENELLEVAYKTTESLTLPVIEESLEVNVPFGMLFSGKVHDYISDSIAVTQQGIVGDVDIVVDIRHSWIGDIKLELEHANRRVLLVKSPGGPACYKDNLFSTKFDTESSDNVSLSKNNVSPGLCQYESQGLFTTDESLQSFNGDPMEGEWILHVTDLLTHQDNGRLVSWGLIIQPKEDHVIISSPAVIPILIVGGNYSTQEQHQRLVEADGRIVDITIHITLGISFYSDHLHLPTMILIHPDGTEIMLSSVQNSLCAYGNYTHIIFDDRVSLFEDLYTDYSCDKLYNVSESSGDFSDIFSEYSGFESDLLDTTMPTKSSLIDIIPPLTNLSMLKGKQMSGLWTLVIHSDNTNDESSLLGWSAKVKREANIDVTYNTTSNTLSLVGEDSISNYQSVLRTIQYQNSLEWPNFSEERLIETVLFDGLNDSNVSFPGSLSYITIHHILIDLDPFDFSDAISPNFAITFTEHGSPVSAVDSNNALIVDPAAQTGLYSLVIKLDQYSNPNLEGLLVNTTMFPDITVTEYTESLSNNTLGLVFNISSNVSQSISNYQSILRSTQYYNDAEEFIGLFRSVSVYVIDRINGNVFTSETAVTEIILIESNDPPVLILSPTKPELPFVVEYTERQEEVFITSQEELILTDNDDETLASITITITNAMDGEDELLSVNETAIDETMILEEYNTTSNTLILFGVDTIENYKSVLSTLTYENIESSPGAPNPTTRIITFVPNDGKTDGLTNITMISFTSVNDAPFGDLNGLFMEGKNTSVVFMEELNPVKLLSPNAVLFDVDNVTLSDITIQITNSFDGKSEELSVNNVSEVVPSLNNNQIIVNNYFPEVEYNYDSSTLTVSGLDTIYAYQQVLKTLTYLNNADEPNPTTRIVKIIMNDGLLDSEPLYSNVMIYLINDSPFLDETATLFSSEIYEDIQDDNNVGFQIKEMAYLIMDDDVNSIPGVAITEIDTSNGIWEYSLSNGLLWDIIHPNVSLNYALSLTASMSRVRFTPYKDFNGIATLTFVAWDSTDNSSSSSYLNAVSVSTIDAFSTEILKATIVVIPVNDAPVLDPISINLAPILEDDYDSIGTTILSLLEHVSDVDISIDDKELLGIAVTTAEQYNGIWQYTENGGDVWNDFGINVNLESALLLRSFPYQDNRIRFVPNKNYNGHDDFTFLAWDLTYAGLVNEEILIDDDSFSGSGLWDISGETSGDFSNNTITSKSVLQKYVNTSLSDQITGPLSVNSSIAIIVTEPVNDSPTVIDEMIMNPIVEDIDQTINHGTQVADIIRDHYGDVDANPMKGLAIIEVDNTFGEWQYTCSSPNNQEWESFIGDIQFGYVVPPLPIVEKATLLLDTCWIRFLPQVHFNTEFDYDHNFRPDSHIPYIVAYGWDNTGLTEGQSGTYGNDASYASHSITNEYSNNQVRIPIMVHSRNDIPILWLSGESISSYETTFYEDLESVSAVGNDLLLIDYDHARLQHVSITIYGEFNESPFNNTELNDFKDSILDEEYLQNIISSGSGDDNDTLTDLQILQDFVKSKADPSPDELYCAGLQERTERILIDVIYTDLVVEITTFCPFTMLIYPDPEKDIVDVDKAMFQKVLRTAQYNNSIQEPLEGKRTVTFIVHDDYGYSIPANTTIDVVIINDAPILDLNDYTTDINNFVTYFEGDSAVVLVNASGLRLVDFDNEYLQNASIILIEAPDTINETLTAITKGTNIIAEYENYTLYLTGNDTVEAYRMVLSTVTYYNNYSGPGNPDQRDREVVFIVSDGDKENLPARAIVNFFGINDRPSVDVNGDSYGPNHTVTFREEEGPITITSPFTILTDEDNDTLAYITATILNPLDGSLESLSVSMSLFMELQEKQASSNVTYNQTSSTLTISGLGSLVDYKQLLKTIMYDNVANEFVDMPRVIQFIASDGLLESNPAYTTVKMMPINDSPYFNDVTIIVPHIYEDSFDNEGTSVYDIANELIVDDDNEYMNINKGIAVIDVESNNGYWEYQTASSNEWKLIQNVTITSALLLNVSDTSLIRFVPNEDFNGNSSLSFVAWDGVDEMPEGIQRFAVSLSDTDPFSNDIRVLIIVVVPVNDAPVLNVSNTIMFTNILEDDVVERPSDGEDVSIFFSSLISDVDQDNDNHEFGVAITETDQSNGYWQYSTDAGVSWYNITVPSPESAIVLRSKPLGDHRIRFVPFTDYNGETSLRFKLWDLNVTYASGTEDIYTITDVITGTFSNDIGTATLIVEPVNDSPIVVAGPTLLDSDEDTIPLLGTYVYLLLANFYTDVDIGINSDTNFGTLSESSELGIAVVGIDNRYGQWQYTCDHDVSNTNWEAFYGDYVFGQLAPRLPNTERATLLLGTCRIRFLPNLDFNTEYDLNGNARSESDKPYIMIKGWDNTGETQGLNGEIGYDTTSSPDNHTNSFSKDIQNATIVIKSANDAPQIFIDGSSTQYTVTYTEPLTPNRIVIPVPVVDPVNFNIIDKDNARLFNVIVSFVRYDQSNERLSIDMTDTELNYDITEDDAEYRLILSPSEGNVASIDNFNMALRSLLYENTAEEPSTINRKINFITLDEHGFVSDVSTTMIYILLVNDPPEIDLNEHLNDTYNIVSYSEGQGPQFLVDDTLSLLDYDNTSLDHVIVTISNLLDGDNEILIANESFIDIKVSYSNGSLLLQGPASIDDFIMILLSIQYNNTLSDPGNPSDDTRMIDIIANDGLNNSFKTTVFLYFTAVNNLPILDINGKTKQGFDFNTQFVEEQGPVPAVASDTTLIDVDNVTIEYIKITLQNPLDKENEKIWVENITETNQILEDKYLVWEFQPIQQYDHNTGILTITGLDSVYEYQQVLRTLKYDNLADEPNTETRVLHFQVSDQISIREGITTTIEMVSINDSPFVNSSVSLYQPISFEDITNEENIGWSLHDLASNWILDDDLDSIPGIAIIHIDTTNGEWEYITDYTEEFSFSSGSGSGSGFDDGGSTFDISTWYTIPDNTSLYYATVLRLNDSYSRLRFVPDHNFNGNVSISLVAWDATDELEDGSITDANSVSETDPFSTKSVSLTVLVQAVNDAPLLIEANVIMTDILEDDVNSKGDEIALYVSVVNDIDVVDTVFGIAITFADNENGEWQFTTDSGQTWQVMIDVSVTNGILLSSSSPMNRIRFVPKENYNGDANIKFLAWDLSSGGSNGETGIRTIDYNSITGPFSITDAIATIYVEPVNDSPFIEEGMLLRSIYEDIPLNENAGTNVSDIVDGFYTDVDNNSMEGIAVVGVNIDNGIWQYKCYGFEQWRDFIGDYIYNVIVPPLPLPEKATILSGDCQVRFLPNYLFNTYEDLNGDPRNISDIPYILVRGWDNTGITSGLSGHYGVDTTHNNDKITNELSFETVKVLVYIDSVNNPPDLNITFEENKKTYTVLFTEDDPFVRIVDQLTVSIRDIDNATLESVTIELTNVYDSEDELIDVDPFNEKIDLNETLVSVNVSGKLEMLRLIYDVYNGTGIGVTNLTIVAYDEKMEVSKEAFEEVIKHLVYINDNSEPSNTTRIVVFHVNDGIDVVSNVYTYIDYKLLAENHPVLTIYLYNFSFIEGSSSPVPLVSNQLTLSDEDHNEYFLIEQIMISIDPIPETINERVSVDISFVSSKYSVSQYYDESTGILLVTGDAPVNVYEDILLTAKYHNIIEEPLPGNRNVKIFVTDSHGLDSNIEQVIINVDVINDREPIITTATESFYYYEHRVNSNPMEIDIHENLSLSDPDSGNLKQQWIEIEIINPLNGPEYEILNATEYYGIQVDYSEGVLSLIGPALISQFQEVLSTITYTNTAEEPVVEERIISVTAFDGIFLSTEENISIIIIGQNDPPVIDLNGDDIDINYIAEFVEGGPPVAIVDNEQLIIADNDNDKLIQIVVKLQNIFDINSEILAINEDALAGTNISSSYSLENGTLTLVGDASLTEYLTVLQTATYNNLESKPGNPNTTMRRIVFIAYDKQNNSIPALTYLTFAAVNDAPILDLNGNEPGQNYSTEFIEEGNSVFLSDANITLKDIDSVIISQVTVKILNCIDGVMEQINVFNDSSLSDSISLESLKCGFNIVGYASIGDYVTVIRFMTYKNLADEPNFDERIIEFTVIDKEGDESEPIYTTVTIIPVNDPPRLKISPSIGVYDSSNFYMYVVNSSNSPNDNEALMSGSGLEDILGGLDDTSGDMEDSNSMSGSGSGSSMSGSGDTSVKDDSSSNNSDSSNTNTKIHITSSVFSTSFVENGPSVFIVEPNFVTVEDDDNIIIDGLEVVIVNEFDEGYETVFFSEPALDTIPEENIRIALKQNPVTSPYISNGCPIGGNHFSVLNITIPLTHQQMVYLIKSLHYCNSDNHPVGGDRNITFRIRDPLGDWSTIETAIVEVIAINDAPIFNVSIPFENEFTISEDHNITIPVLHLFYDYEEQLTGESIKITSLQPNIGTATVDSVTGDISYNPILNDNGVWVISYVSCDSMGTCSSPVQNLTIIITPVNDLPYTIGNLTLEIIEDIPTHINLTIFFGDVEDDASGILSYPKASYKDSALTLLEALIVDNGYGGLLTATSRNNTAGSDVLNFEVCDSMGSCITVPLTIIIRPVNDIPEIVVNYVPGESHFITNEDITLIMNVTFYDIESTLDTPIFGDPVDDGNGSVIMSINAFSIVPDSDSVVYRRGNLKQDMYVSYTPDSNFYGSDVITISATDSQGGYIQQTIDIVVAYINDPPYFGITEVTTKEDLPIEIVLPQDLNVTDPEDQLHGGSFKIIQSPQYGTLSYTYNNDEDSSIGTLIYTPNSEYYSTLDKPEYFIIQACDDDVIVPDNKLCTNATINVTVESTNDPPIVAIYSVEIDEEHTYTENILKNISDVEDGIPPADKVTIILPIVMNGTATYNDETGFITYVPNKDFYGIQYVHYESCDTENSCNNSGLITINVVDVNDPPIAADFTSTAREDIFELIDIHMYSSDLEDDEEKLLISIIDPVSGEYLNDGEVITGSGAGLRVYQEHGIITYEPSPDFVGFDSFRYAICDTCDVSRNGELGRTNLDDYPQCLKQLNENGGSRNKIGENIDITCDEGIVNIMVINTNDIPVVKDLSGRTFQGNSLILNPLLDSALEYTNGQLFYSNASSLIYDPDDAQTVEALTEGFNLTAFFLRNSTDIDVSSLEVDESMVTNGQVSIDVNDENIPYLLYTPNDGFSGYEVFNYKLCDIQSGSEPPRCSEAKVTIFVTKPGPDIISITAVPNLYRDFHNDSKVSKGDKIVIRFREDTNMPPHNALNVSVSADDIDMIFEFPKGFIPPILYQNRYTGLWTNRDQFEITIVDEGYPQPENEIGDWNIHVKKINQNQCGGTDSFGNQIIPNEYCLLSADTYSEHSSSTSPPIDGNWGLRLPELITIVVSDDITTSAIRQVLFRNSLISLYLREPFSHNQLVLYCSQDPMYILDFSKIGQNVSMTITGCENLLLDGQNTFKYYEDQIERSKDFFDVLEFGNNNRKKRQTAVSGVTEQPVVSKIILQVIDYTNLTISSVSDIAQTINYTTMAEVVSQLSGVNSSEFEVYTSSLPPNTDAVVGTYFEKDDSLTPKISSITADDPNCLHLGFGDGDTISIEFDRATDEPRLTTKSDIDRVFTFEPSIGIDYTGFWETPSKAVINIVSIANIPAQLSFTPNYLDNDTVFNESNPNPNLPIDQFHCYGINVCGTGGPTTGVCSSNGLSCRAHEAVIINNLEFNGGNRCLASSSQGNDWLWVLLAIFLLIVAVALALIVYYCCRKNKHKRQKEEAMRVVERWHKTPKSKDSIKDSSTAPWAKPPDVFSMRDQPDPFRDEGVGVLRNLPEMVKRPPTAAAAENLPPIDTIPTTFVPRAGARIVPGLPALPPIPLRDGAINTSRNNSLPSLTPLVSNNLGIEICLLC